uniref:Zasp-like motif domain-containing protein n=1 Tax=Octopus bimaculoides TaxID=37653 RepID=A0A0L8GTX7_OCTBM
MMRNEAHPFATLPPLPRPIFRDSTKGPKIPRTIRQHYNQSARKGPKVDVQAAKKEAAAHQVPTYTPPPQQQQQQQSYPSPHSSNASPISPTYARQPHSPVTPITPGAGSGTFVHGQYNSPLGLYSAEAATEELACQSGGVITAVGGDMKISGGPKYDPCRLPDKPKINYRDSEVYKLINENESAKRAEEARRAEEAADMKLTGSNPSKQSLSFKVLQWMTDTEKPAEEEETTTPTDTNTSYDADSHIGADQYVRQVSRKKQKNPLLRHNSEDDEMRFSGLHSKRDIPSKSFKMLQNLTVSDSQDEVSSQDTQDEDGVGNYCEASIRYKGKHIPSPSFRVLQNWADTDTDPTPDSGLDTEEETVGNSVMNTSIRYTGKCIPSPTFQVLKAWADKDVLPSPKMRKSRSKPKRPPIEEDEDKSDGPVEVRYSGGNIPSRVFKVLQMSVGGSDPIEPTSSENPSEDEDRSTKSLPRQSRSMRVIQKAKVPEDSGCTDF